MSTQQIPRSASARRGAVGFATLVTAVALLSPLPAPAKTIACKTAAAWVIDEHGENIAQLTKLTGTSLTAVLDDETRLMTIEGPLVKTGTLKCNQPDKPTDELSCKGTTADGRADTFHTMGGRMDAFRTTWFGNQAIVMACPKFQN